MAKFKFVSLLLTLTFLTSTGWADPVNFFDNAVMPGSGPRAGQALDTTRVRPVMHLDHTLYGVLNTSPTTHYLVGNIYHQGKFHIAMIPRHGADYMRYERVKFGFMAYHSMGEVVFRDDAPILLVADIPTPDEQAKGLLPKAYAKPIPLHSVLLSGEAAFAPGQNFDLVHGLQDWFSRSYRMISVEERARQYYAEGMDQGAWRPIVPYMLDYRGPEIDNIVAEWIDESEFYGLSSTYNTLSRQCTTMFFDVIQKAVPLGSRDRNPILRAWDVMWGKVGFLDAIIPSLSPMGLRLRGIISHTVEFDGHQLVLFGRQTNLEKDPAYVADFTKGYIEYLRERPALPPKTAGTEASPSECGKTLHMGRR